MSGIKSKLKSVKNNIMMLSKIEIAIKEATNSESWGPTAAQLTEISQASYSREDYRYIIPILQTRLNEKGFQHVNKTLIVVRHLLEAGIEQFAHDLSDYQYSVQNILQRRYVDEENHDRSHTVHTKAQEIVKLLSNRPELGTLREKYRETVSHLPSNVFQQYANKPVSTGHSRHYQSTSPRKGSPSTLNQQTDTSNIPYDPFAPQNQPEPRQYPFDKDKSHFRDPLDQSPVPFNESQNFPTHKAGTRWEPDAPNKPKPTSKYSFNPNRHRSRSSSLSESQFRKLHQKASVVKASSPIEPKPKPSIPHSDSVEILASPFVESHLSHTHTQPLQKSGEPKIVAPNFKIKTHSRRASNPLRPSLARPKSKSVIRTSKLGLVNNQKTSGPRSISAPEDPFQPVSSPIVNLGLPNDIDPFAPPSITSSNTAKSSKPSPFSKFQTTESRTRARSSSLSSVSNRPPNIFPESTPQLIPISNTVSPGFSPFQQSLSQPTSPRKQSTQASNFDPFDAFPSPIPSQIASPASFPINSNLPLQSLIPNNPAFSNSSDPFSKFSLPIVDNTTTDTPIVNKDSTDSQTVAPDDSDDLLLEDLPDIEPENSKIDSKIDSEIDSKIDSKLPGFSHLVHLENLGKSFSLNHSKNIVNEHNQKPQDNPFLQDPNKIDHSYQDSLLVNNIANFTHQQQPATNPFTPSVYNAPPIQPPHQIQTQPQMMPPHGTPYQYPAPIHQAPPYQSTGQPFQGQPGQPAQNTFDQPPSNPFARFTPQPQSPKGKSNNNPFG